jgi:predicted transposase YbfD/YdcC
MVSAWATTERLVLAQEAVDEKANECAAIPEVLDRLDLKGALVTVDAIACNPTIAEAITSRGGAYLLAVKANQPTLCREIAAYFADPVARTETVEELDKGHGRLESRRYAISREVDWLSGDRRYPDEPRFPGLRAVARVEAQVEKGGETTCATRYYLSSAPLTAERLAQAIRGHWGIENSLHWVLDVIFKEDQSRLRTGHGARNMAVVRHFAINAVRLAKGKRSIKTTRKRAGWNAEILASILRPSPR